MSSQSRLVADDADVAGDKHLVHSYEIWHSAAHMTIAPITAYFYQFFSLWVVIFLTDSCSF